jgi:hypothetical protein
MRKTFVLIAAAAAMAILVVDSSRAQQPINAPPPGAKGGDPAFNKGKGGGGGGKGKAAAPAGPTPRTADGKVILDGETPGKNGVWTPNIGITAPAVPLENIKFQPWAKALYDNRQTNELEPHTRCKPSGAARQFMTPYGVEFTELPELQRIYIFDIGGPHTFRTIYMDGRSHPDKFMPNNYGHSIGWWEGDALVVDTVGYSEDFWLDRRGLPHTEQLHTIERFTRTDKNTIDYKLTVDDPGAYLEPYTGGFTLRYNENQELFEYVCQQANYASELMVGDQKKVDRTSPIIP